MYVAYSDGNGGVTLSQRSAPGHVQPTISSTQSFVKLGTTIPEWAKKLTNAQLVANFNRTIAANGANDISTASATSCIWAVSPNTPPNPTSTSSNFVQHSDYGSFSLDLSAAGGVSTGSSTSPAVILDVQTLRLLHGIFMFLAWGVFPAVGVFTARYLKDTLGHNWYRIHVGCMVGGTLLFTALGLAAIELQIPSSAKRFVGDGSAPHRPIGTVISFAFLPVQIILGYVANALFSPDRPSVPWWDQLHWWLGRSTIVLAIVEMYLGLDLYGSSVVIRVLYWVWIAVVVGMMVGGHFMFGGAVHHVLRNSKTLKPPYQGAGEMGYADLDGPSQSKYEAGHWNAGTEPIGYTQSSHLHGSYGIPQSQQHSVSAPIRYDSQPTYQTQQQF
ncbi:hypothetical protein DFJ73DRAFT_624501 [Zopfochytrium polystomum]|nr:hypothetical protein DFJ73DRAFT_624501 [Zopfochytrium polystomum]